MLPNGYDPKNYNGKVWWNENNPEMREIWGTQEDYDNHIKQGGTWEEYVQLVKEKKLNNNFEIETPIKTK